MAEMKPIGIDQTTGQQRAVESDDNVTNTIGDVIEIAIRNVGDYSGGSNQVQVLYPWDTPTKLNDPASGPTGFGIDASWSPNGEYLAIGHVTSPYLTVLQRTGRHHGHHQY